VCSQKISDTVTHCCANTECASGTCNLSTGKCQATGTGTLANGQTCSSSTQCISSCCDSLTGNKCQPTGGGAVNCLP
jgi:hypothetical protein